MLLIPCPWCGPRPQTDFTYGGDGTVFQRFNPADDSIVTLAPSANVSNHSTITVLRAP